MIINKIHNMHSNQSIFIRINIKFDYLQHAALSIITRLLSWTIFTHAHGNRCIDSPSTVLSSHSLYGCLIKIPKGLRILRQTQTIGVNAKTSKGNRKKKNRNARKIIPSLAVDGGIRKESQKQRPKKCKNVKIRSQKNC